jgi:hypothetical protein
MTNKKSKGTNYIGWGGDQPTDVQMKKFHGAYAKGEFVNKMNKEVEKKIREICTYHSEDGTSGYCLSNEQFEKLFDLLDQDRVEMREEMIKKVEGKKANSRPSYDSWNVALDEIIKLLKEL